MIESMNGQAWARRTLTAALAVSIAYNIANICLTETPVHVLLRIPQGIVWPGFLFLGIEVMVRNRDLKPRLAKVARFFLMGVTVPTAITSYINLHDFMVKAGEPGIAQVSGPLAIDGLMLGCTLYLLAARESATLPTAAPIGPMPEPELPLSVLMPEPREWSTAELDNVPLSPAPAGAERVRAPRAEWNARAVVELAVDGAKAREIHEKLGVPMSTAGRFTKVARTLRADPKAEISAAEKVHPDHVRMMRELISR